MTEKEVGKWDLEMFLKVLRTKRVYYMVSWSPFDDTYHVVMTLSERGDDKLDIVSDKYGRFKRPVYHDVKGEETEVLEDVRNFNDAYIYLFGD